MGIGQQIDRVRFGLPRQSQSDVGEFGLSTPVLWQKHLSLCELHVRGLWAQEL